LQSPEGIPGGQSYAEAISAAIDSCSALVSVCSNNYWASRNTLHEVDLAWQNRKYIVPVAFTDSTPPRGFDYYLSAIQAIPTYGRSEQAWVAELEDALRLLGIGAESKGLSRGPWPRRNSARRRGPELRPKAILPFLVNRGLQNDAIDAGIYACYQRQLSKAALFFVYGRTEQRVDMYQKRLVDYEIRRVLNRIGLPDEFEHFYVEWPSGIHRSISSIPLEEQLRRLRGTVLEKVGLPPTASDQDLRKAFLNLHRPAVIHSTYGLDLADSLDVSLLSDWIAAWSRFPGLPASQPLIVLFFARYTQDSRPIIGRLNTLRRRRYVHSMVRHLKSRFGATVNLVPELGNVHREHVTAWVTETVKPADPNAMLAEVHDLFRASSKRSTEGMTMASLARQLGSMLDRHFMGDS